MVQLVTSKLSDVGTGVQISVSSHELGFFLSGERLLLINRVNTQKKVDFTVDERKEWLNPPREKN